MTTKKPAKKAKKSPAPKAGSVNPLKCVRPGCRNVASTPNLICAKHLRSFKRTALYRGIQRIREQHPAPTPSPDRRVEEVKAMCEETLRWDKKHCMASKILRILNSKGPR